MRMPMNLPLETRLISGTFVQLDHWSDEEGVRFQRELRSLGPDGWRRMLNDMHAIGIDTLIFQQGLDCRNGKDDPRAYYPSKHFRQPEWLRRMPELYTEVIDEADALGMKVFHGIGAMHGADPYLETDAAIAQSAIVVQELLERYADRPSFAGWYWTNEYSPAIPAGRDSLRRIVPAIRRLAPQAQFMIAPNGDRGISPTLLEDIDVDIANYQDTVGLGVEPDVAGRFGIADRHHTLHRLPYLYERLRFAHNAWQDRHAPEIRYGNCYFRDRGRTALWNDLEIWEFDCRCELVPTEISRVVAQLDLTAPFVDKQTIYQYPGLMCHPDNPIKTGGERAVTLYENYACYRAALLAQEGIPCAE